MNIWANLGDGTVDERPGMRFRGWGGRANEGGGGVAQMSTHTIKIKDTQNTINRLEIWLHYVAQKVFFCVFWLVCALFEA